MAGELNREFISYVTFHQDKNEHAHSNNESCFCGYKCNDNEVVEMCNFLGIIQKMSLILSDAIQFCSFWYPLIYVSLPPTCQLKLKD